MLEERSAGVVLFNRAEGLQFLVLKYPSGHWDFVKGNIEQGEKEEETVKRELFEETGINSITLHKGFNEKDKTGRIQTAAGSPGYPGFI